MTRVTSRMIEPTPAAIAAMGFERGTEVMTLAGVRPIEALHEGDRVITRAGATPLRGVMRTANGYSLEFDTPQVVFLSEGQVHSDTGLPFAA